MSQEALYAYVDVDSVVPIDLDNDVVPVEHKIDMERCIRQIRHAIANLEPKVVRSVIKKRYGFDIDFTPRTVAEVANELDLTFDEVKSIEILAIQLIIERVGMDRLMEIMQIMIDERALI